MKKWISIALAALLLAAGLAGCKMKTPEGSAGVVTEDMILGVWELYEPVGGWASRIEIQNGGKLMLNNSEGKWKLADNALEMEFSNGQMMRFNVTAGHDVAADYDYYMVLDHPLIDSGLWYINPQKFAAGVESDNRLTGRWMETMQSEILQLDADGSFTRTSFMDNTTKRQKYFARDYILRVYDDDMGASYYNYSVGDSYGGLMHLGSTNMLTGYTGTDYYPQGDTSTYAGQWKQVGKSGHDALPTQVELRADGTGTMSGAQSDAYNQEITWTVFGEELLFMDAQGQAINLYCSAMTGSFYLAIDTEDFDAYGEAVYACDALLVDEYESLTTLEGEWATNDDVIMSMSAEGHMKLTIPGDGTVTVLEGDTKIGSNMIKLTTADQEIYFNFEIEISGQYLSMGNAHDVMNGTQYWYFAKVLD